LAEPGGIRIMARPCGVVIARSAVRISKPWCAATLVSIG